MMGILKRIDILLVVILAIHLLVLTQVQFTPWPELQLWPYLEKNGFQVYKNIAFEKPPLLLTTLSIWFSIFGNTLTSLKLFTWSLLLFIDILVFYIGSKILSLSATESSLALAGYVSMSIALGGNGLWFDLFVVPFILISLIFIFQRKYFLSGLFTAFAVLTKQNAILVPLLASFVLAKEKKVIWSEYLKGLFIPVLITIVALVMSNSIRSFFEWVIIFPRYVSELSLKLPDLKMGLVILIMVLTLLSSVNSKYKLGLWGLVSLSFIYPRFELFHLQPALPFIALSIILLLKKKKLLGIILLILLVAFSSRQISRSWERPTRFYEDTTITAATWIKLHTNPGDKIFLLNTWDNIYVLSETLPATDPWYPYLPWYLKNPSVETNILNDLSNVRPKYIISENLTKIARNRVESFVYTYYSPSLVLNDRFTVWMPK